MENIAGLHCVFLRKRKPWKSNPIGSIQLGSKVSEKEKPSRLAEAVGETGSGTSH